MKSLLQRLLSVIRRLLGSWYRPYVLSTRDRDETIAPRSFSEPFNSQAGLHGEALALARQICGKTFHLPDMREVFKDWPMATNPHQKRVESLVDMLLERIINDERKLKSLKRANFAHLISRWYPHADWAELEVATAYSVWIFVWDDEIDVGDTDISNDEELTRAYYQASLNYVSKKLGLGFCGSTKLKPVVDENKIDDEPPHNTMVLFSNVGIGMRVVTDITQRQRFYRELKNFMLQVGVEQTYRLSGDVPTLETYLAIRSGSVGCAPQIAITDYMLKMRLPESIMESKPMKALWRETVLICLILNDVYSVQKEIAHGSVFNIVPVMFKEYGPERPNLDVVDKELITLLQDSMARFEIAAIDLGALAVNDLQLGKDTQEFIKWCRYFITGVLDWSLVSHRYGMAKCLLDDGSLDILL